MSKILRQLFDYLPSQSSLPSANTCWWLWAAPRCRRRIFTASKLGRLRMRLAVLSAA